MIPERSLENVFLRTENEASWISFRRNSQGNHTTVEILHYDGALTTQYWNH